LHAQVISFRFVAVDMFGGAVAPSGFNAGVAFGARLGFGELLHRAVRFGVEVDWWTARHETPPYELRDILGGIAVWKEFGSTGVVHPYLGAGAAMHSIDTSPVDSTTGSLPPEARRLDGARIGASVFAGVGLRMSWTGTMWLLLEYRYTAISDVPYHELRAGLRLSGSRQR
jgi:opacity protein-like surface antigen